MIRSKKINKPSCFNENSVQAVLKVTEGKNTKSTYNSRNTKTQGMMDFKPYPKEQKKTK